MSGPRIVSLIASATETVSALGFGGNLVGRSHECDYPATVRNLPACTAAKLDSAASSAEIDRQVKALVAGALSVYLVEAETLKELRPDVIVTQDQCEVCAVSLKEVEEAVCEWVDRSVRIVTLRPDSLDNVFTDVRRVAEALDAPAAGEALTAGMRQRMAAVETHARSLEETPTVACVEWIDPLMAAGNWMPELVSMAGGENLFGSAGRHSPWISFEDLRAADPDVIAVLPCGFDRIRTPRRNGAVDPTSGLGGAQGRQHGPRLRHRRQPVFQPARSAPRRVRRDHGRDAASRRIRFRAPGCRLGNPLATRA